MIYHRGAAQNGYGTIRQDPSAARQEPRLAEKLRREYRGRGEDLRGVGAASTEELMRRVAMGRDPRVNVSEEAFEQRLHNRGQSFTYPQNARPRTQYTNYQRSNPQRRNTDGYTARNPGQRTGEGAGISGVILSRDTVDLFNPKTIRSTMGSIYRMPFVCLKEGEMPEALTCLRERGITTCAAHLKGEHTYDKEDYTTGCAFMIGNEGNGLTDKAAGAASLKVRIPMEGKLESLNASVAASILLYEAYRQRRQ